MKFSTISLNNLKDVHPDLVRVAYAAIAATSVDFRVIDGLRTLAEERQHVKKGTSQTLNSMHLKRKDGFSHAIDFVVLTKGQPDWFHIANFINVVSVFKQVAAQLKVPIICGADWKTLKDYGHIELNRKFYPG